MEICHKNFLKFKIAVGTIILAKLNHKAKKPAYEVDIDFGDDIGIKKTSAQITNYQPDELLGRQIIAVTNFPSKNIAGVVSEVLVLAAVNETGAHLLKSDINIKNGTLVS